MTARLGSAATLAAFTGALAAVFAAAYGVGALAGDGTSPGPATSGAHVAEKPGAGHAAPAVSPPDVVPPGLAVSRDGYTLTPASPVLPAGPDVPLEFTVVGPDGRPVTDYRPTHERDLHLVVVRRDLTGFQHVHPTLAGDGTWSVPLDLSAPGSYRVLADFAPAQGAPVVLGADVAVGGEFQPVPVPAPAATAVVDGYEVTLAGAPAAGAESELAFTVRRDGEPVTDLEPYLGAFGHLVALRAGDLAYLHTHPVEEASPGESGGPEVRFGTAFPTAGTYRLHLDFAAGGQVHTAAFTVEVPASGAARGPAPASAPQPHDADPHGH